MYKSPITALFHYPEPGVDPDILAACMGVDDLTRKIQKDINEKQEQAVYNAIKCQMAVEVDKDELMRALAYDRHQYDEGYRDGYATAKAEFDEKIEKAINSLMEVGNDGMD